MKTLVMKEKILEKLRDSGTYQTTNVSPTMCSSVSNLVPIQCLDIVLLPY